jgi:hypothetical protein
MQAPVPSLKSMLMELPLDKIDDPKISSSHEFVLVRDP